MCNFPVNMTCHKKSSAVIGATGASASSLAPKAKKLAQFAQTATMLQTQRLSSPDTSKRERFMSNSLVEQALLYKRKRSLSYHAPAEEVIDFEKRRCRVPLQVVEEFEGETDAAFMPLPDSAIRLNVSTRDHVRICWSRKPETVVIIKRFRDPEATEQLIQLGTWMRDQRQMKVLVEPVVAETEATMFAPFDSRDPGQGVDFIVCIGGDGTLLHVSSLFPTPLAIPPVLCFKGGSLGFLCSHDFSEHRALIDRMLNAVSTTSPAPSHLSLDDEEPLPLPSSSSSPSAALSSSFGDSLNLLDASISSTSSSASSTNSSVNASPMLSSSSRRTSFNQGNLDQYHLRLAPPQPSTNGDSHHGNGPVSAANGLKCPSPRTSLAVPAPSPMMSPTSGINAQSLSSSSTLRSSGSSSSLFPASQSSSSSSASSSSSSALGACNTPSFVSTSSSVIQAPPVFVIPRMRLFCRVYRQGDRVPIITQQPFNELLVDRGSSSFMSTLELYVDGKMATTVQADGLIVATPSGSSAYSLSAGGPLVAPSLCAILVTPICPHSLSFRPLLLPDCSKIRIRLPEGARASAWASFDGRAQTELHPGDYVQVMMSRNPLPTISFSDHNSEWFDSLVQKLHWNVRPIQKPLPPKSSASAQAAAASDLYS